MDSDTFARRARALWPGMVRMAFCILKNQSDAEDAAAQTVLRCFERLPSLRREDALEAWMMRACVNQSRTFLRRRGRVVLRDEWPEEAAPAPREGPALMPLLMRLSQKDRVVLMLMYYENQTVDEIARVLGVPRGTAASRIGRARKRLRALWEEEARCE